jgi:hypothetical protein
MDETCAVAASILTAIFHMLSDGTFYQDLGADYFQLETPPATNQQAGLQPLHHPKRKRKQFLSSPKTV